MEFSFDAWSTLEVTSIKDQDLETPEMKKIYSLLPHCARLMKTHPNLFYFLSKYLDFVEKTVGL